MLPVPFIALALIGNSSAAAQDALINEALYDVSGSDDGNEWIELCNPSASEVDLAGWTVEVTSAGRWKTAYELGSGTLSPGGHLLVGAGSSRYPGGFSPNLPNAGSHTDGIRLVDASGQVVDTLLYGSPNSSGYTDDLGGTGPFASKAGPDEALARIPDCTDTNDIATDFQVVASPTPGAKNVAESGDTGGSDTGEPTSCDGSGVKINEFLSNATGTDSSANQWVELYNAGATVADLSGWQLQWGTRSFSNSAKIPNGTTLDPGAFLVIGGAEIAEADVVVSMDLGNASSNADGLRVVDCSGTVVDTVIYGSSNDDGWIDDSGSTATSLAPAPGEGQTVGRAEDGVDTDRSGDDFVALSFASPGESNATQPDCPGKDDIKINEFMPDPDGSDSGNEWVELYNAGSEDYSLFGWQLQWGTSSFSKSADLGDATIGAGQWLLIGDSEVSGADVTASLSLGNASSSGDALRLVHCGGGVADTVIYGPDNSDGFLDDNGEVATSVAPSPDSGASLARIQDGYDTNDSGSDFAVAQTPTPGASNPEITPPECHAGNHTIKINELFPDPEGTDSGNEWVELYNAGTDSQRLDSWTIEKATSSWGTAYTFAGGVELPPGGFLLVGGEDVPTDYIASDFSLGNASTAPDGVRLLDCTGSLQDTVLYGKAQDPAQDDLTDDAGYLTMATMPRTGDSIGRYPDGADSDDNSADFVEAVPTPGASNAKGLASGSGNAGPSKACGKRPDANDQPQKCGVLPKPTGGLTWMLLAMVAFWRRRADR